MFARGTQWSDLGVDYGIEFFDASKALSGTSGDDDLSVLMSNKVELDTNFLIQDIATSGMTLEGGDGVDDFSGGAGNDHFSEATVLTVCYILTPRVLGLGSPTIKLRR